VISMLSTALGKMMFFTLSFIFLLFSTTNNYATAHSYHTHDVVTTTTQEPDGDGNDEKCSLNPCAPQCGTCRRDGVCRPSCMSEYGYICESPTGSLGKNTSFAPPSIDCKLNEIHVTIVDGFFGQPDFVSNYFYISKKLDDREKCQLTRAAASGSGLQSPSSQFVIDTRTQSHCMEKEVHDGVEYSTTLWADIQGNGFDMPIPIISFRCEYRTDYYVRTEMRPLVATSATIVEDGVQLDLEIDLCKQSTCERDCPEELRVNGQNIYTVGQRVYVGIKSIGHENTVVSGHTMSLQDVYLSCSANAESPSQRLEIFEDGCLESGIGQLFARPGALQVHRACFSFLLARVDGCKEKFYIHAYVNVCNRASRQCSDGTKTCPASRSKRSTSEEETPMTIGPLYIVYPEQVSNASFNVLPYGQAPVDAVSNLGPAVHLPTSLLPKPASEQLVGNVEVEDDGVDSNTVDIILIVGISLLMFSILLFSFLFFQFHSKYSGSRVDGLKK